ncbi:unnamed protein product, partial [Brassica rapa subsp. trilocularis]
LEDTTNSLSSRRKLPQACHNEHKLLVKKEQHFRYDLIVGSSLQEAFSSWSSRRNNETSLGNKGCSSQACHLGCVSLHWPRSLFFFYSFRRLNQSLELLYKKEKKKNFHLQQLVTTDHSSSKISV